MSISIRQVPYPINPIINNLSTSNICVNFKKNLQIVKRKKLIPDVPDPLVLSEELEQKLVGWKMYFRNMSFRIKVIDPSDEGFDLKEYENKCKLNLGYSDDVDDIKLIDWPSEKQIAFIVIYNSAFPGQTPQFLVKDATIFCYYDFAFSFNINNFEQSEELSYDTKGNYYVEYYLYDWREDFFSWEHQKNMIINALINIEESIPSTPTQ
ncbi:MAG: hypothetical protein KGI58_00975 [Patescibacteria group bacterium]|nr:hypothetical protein [Patescibacteria group bacterium]